MPISSVRHGIAFSEQNPLYLVAVKCLSIPTDAYLNLHAADRNQVSG